MRRPRRSQASNVADETVTVDGRELKLAYEGEAGGDTIQEFIPTDETLETWTAWLRSASTPN